MDINSLNKLVMVSLHIIFSSCVSSGLERQFIRYEYDFKTGLLKNEKQGIHIDSIFKALELSRCYQSDPELKNKNYTSDSCYLRQPNKFFLNDSLSVNEVIVNFRCNNHFISILYFDEEEELKFAIDILGETSNCTVYLDREMDKLSVQNFLRNDTLSTYGYYINPNIRVGTKFTVE